MFTLEDIRNIAVQIEQNGEAAYRQAAESTAHPIIARLLGLMAAEEEKHARWFSKLGNPPGFVFKDDQIERIGRELLQNMLAQQTFSLEKDGLSGATDVNDVLGKAIEFENDTILFYEMLHGFLDDSKIMVQLESIIAEEQAHIDKLKEIVRLLDVEQSTS